MIDISRQMIKFEWKDLQVICFICRI